MNKIAEAYVKLVLEIGLYDEDYVDAYYGPKEWRTKLAEKQEPFPFDQLNSRVVELIDQLNSLKSDSLESFEKQRQAALGKQLKAVQAKIEMLSGRKFSFDEESERLYDAVAPINNETYFKKLLTKIEDALPGNGPIADRFNRFNENFIIPKDKLDSVFKAAIKECSRRTHQHMTLPEHESFTVAYVTNKVWTAYNWYKGNSHSLIELNTDLPSYIDRAIDLAAHEGYPGHHVYNVLLENKLFLGLGWMEYSVYPLFSPQSLIAEGTANYGIKITFPENERHCFEKEVLFPLAGLDAEQVKRYYEIISLKHGLDYATNEAARNYQDGRFSNDDVVEWLVLYTLATPERAKKMISFFEYAGSYVINYNLGEDIVKAYVESKVNIAEDRQKTWKVFANILSTPQTPSALIKATKFRSCEPRFLR